MEWLRFFKIDGSDSPSLGAGGFMPTLTPAPILLEETMEPLTPQLPQLYPSEVLSKLKRAERKLELQDLYIAQTGALLALTIHKQTL
jgi:hypothetical protein